MRQKKIWGTLDPFVEGGDVLGRKVANRNFLYALLTANPFDEYHFFLAQGSAQQYLQQWLVDNFPLLVAAGVCKFFDPCVLHKAVSATSYFCFHVSDCLSHMTPLIRVRNAYSRHVFPITGVTHSLSYARYMPDYVAHMWQGVSARDAIVVTSNSACAMLAAVFDGVKQGYGLPVSYTSPALVRIPLGVTVPDEKKPKASEEAVRLRHEMGIAHDDCVLLCLGRISVDSKMDIIPLFSALKRAESEGVAAGTYVLVLAGWADRHDMLPHALAEYAAGMDIRFVVRLCPSDEECALLWELADIFVSPSDNIQETFGLTLLEAAAAGVPVVASDFDGYRDIVVDNETGFLVPTYGCAVTAETDVLAGLWFDNQYHLKLAQQTAIDVPALACALGRLMQDAQLRQRMGEKAQARARAFFSWKKVVTQYLSLWDSLTLATIDKTTERCIRESQHPATMNFARYFAGHFSQMLGPDSDEQFVVQCTQAGEAAYRKKKPLLRYAGYEYFFDEPQALRMLLYARKPMTVSELLTKMQQGADETSWLHTAGSCPEGFRQERFFALVLWALKHDYLERVK